MGEVVAADPVALDLLHWLARRDDTAAASAASFAATSAPDASFLFAFDKGMFSLSPARRDKLRVSLLSVVVPYDDPCLGGPMTRWMLQNLVGYHSVFVNALVHSTGGKGFFTGESMFRANTDGISSISHASEIQSFSEGALSLIIFKIGTLCSALFLLFSSSSLVSFILSQTQDRMLRFTMALQARVMARLPLLPLIAAHLLSSLVFVPLMLGVLFFLFEFFSNQLLAFLVLVAVWVCEVFSLTTCRTAGSMRVFPKVFGAAFTWFHVYYLAYPFGYHFVALGCVACLIATTMFFLWNRYELPALLIGTISAAATRAPEVAAIMGPGFAGVPHPTVLSPTMAQGDGEWGSDRARTAFPLQRNREASPQRRPASWGWNDSHSTASSSRSRSGSAAAAPISGDIHSIATPPRPSHLSDALAHIDTRRNSATISYANPRREVAHSPARVLLSLSAEHLESRAPAQAAGSTAPEEQGAAAMASSAAEPAWEDCLIPDRIAGASTMAGAGTDVGATRMIAHPGMACLDAESPPPEQPTSGNDSSSNDNYSNNDDDTGSPIVPNIRNRTRREA
jgi:hypothetical protein